MSSSQLNSTKVVGTSDSGVQDYLKDIRALRNGIAKPYKFKFDSTKIKNGNNPGNAQYNYIHTEVLGIDNNFHFIGYIDENAVNLIKDGFPITLQHIGGVEEKPTFGLKVHVYEKRVIQTESSIFASGQIQTSNQLQTINK